MKDYKEQLPSSRILHDMLNDLDTGIYVSDLKTDEILFINKKMKERFNLSEPASGVCWRILREGLDRRCDFCPICLLIKDPYTPVVWEEYDAKADRVYKNIDRIIEWSGEKKVHLQHSIDITDTKTAAEESTHKELEREELLTKPVECLDYMMRRWL